MVYFDARPHKQITSSRLHDELRYSSGCCYHLQLRLTIISECKTGVDKRVAHVPPNTDGGLEGIEKKNIVKV